MSTITRVSDSQTSTPQFISGYDAAYESGNVVQKLIGGDIAVTLVAQSPRSGTLHLYYADASDAEAAILLHLGTDTFTLTDTDVAFVDMTYVAGTITPTIRVSETDLWLVDVEFQELT